MATQIVMIPTVRILIKPPISNKTRIRILLSESRVVVCTIDVNVTIGCAFVCTAADDVNVMTILVTAVVMVLHSSIKSWSVPGTVQLNFAALGKRYINNSLL